MGEGEGSACNHILQDSLAETEEVDFQRDIFTDREEALAEADALFLVPRDLGLNRCHPSTVNGSHQGTKQ